MLLTSRQWCLAFVVGLATAIVFAPWYTAISAWIGVTLFVMAVTVVHMRYASVFVVPFPHFAVLIAALQYVLAAWVSRAYPPRNPEHDIGACLPQYLAYAAPVIVATAVGWGMGMAKLRPQRQGRIQRSPQLLQFFDLLIVIGFLGLGIIRILVIPYFGFVLVLISNLRYIGVYGHILCKSPGWHWRLALMLGAEVVLATRIAFFHSLILFVAWSFAIWVYSRTPSWRTIIAAGILAALLLPVLQQSKLELRRYVWVDSGRQQMTASGKVSLWVSSVSENLRRTATGGLDTASLGVLAVRYNQGWIVNRVMQHVPRYEPFAQGGTLKEAMMGALLPRFLAPNKIVVGGQMKMDRYAGYRLNDSTSMNLGYAGEMYANFGSMGGIIGCGFYALVLALFFRVFCNLAFKSPLWWCVLPYVCFPLMKAEEGLEVLGWPVKACLVIMGVWIAFPVFRRALLPPSPTGSSNRYRTPREYRPCRNQ
ncbi:MAG: hypothetical protein ISR77_18435 [Pirellulaceae bacterium]|nr:hypothetical protein [Pirellulaceae bacterium]